MPAKQYYYDVIGTSLEIWIRHSLYFSLDNEWQLNVSRSTICSNRSPPSPSSTLHYSQGKKSFKVFLKYASWTDICQLFWMSHCLSGLGRKDFEWCWMFYDSLLLCHSSPALLGDFDNRTSSTAAGSDRVTQASNTWELHFKMPCFNPDKMLPGIYD